jgi:hypothetical protein
VECIIREEVEIVLHPDNMGGIDDFFLRGHRSLRSNPGGMKEGSV